MKPSFRNRLRYLILLVGVLIFLGLGIFGVITVAQELELIKSDFVKIVVLAVSILFLGSATFFLVIFFSFYRNRKIEKLAYTNLSFNIPNELYFQKMMALNLKRGKKGAVIAYYFHMNQDLLVMQLGYEQSEIIREVLLEVSKTYLNEVQGSIIAFHSHSFCLIYLPDSATPLEKHLNKIAEEFDHQLFKNEIYTRIALAFGVFKVTAGKDQKVDDMIENANFARLSIINNAAHKDIVYYSDTLVQKSVNELQLHREIADGLLNEQFEVYYQPKFNIRLNRFIGAEALIKWNHPEKGMVSAGGFIPFAEKSNLIVDLDRYIFRHVLTDIVRWKAKGFRLLPISINITINDAYQQDLISFLKTSFSQYGVSPQLVELELTESAISKDMHFIVQVLKDIRALGIKVNMDDFGTGYSSLSMLSKLPLDAMKVDKSFFDQVEIDKKARDVVKGMINLGKTCGLTVIAEGIETEKQIAFLKSTKCDIVQGYYYSPSLRRTDYEHLLKSNKFEIKEVKKV